MKADLNIKAVKAFGLLFAVQHAPRLGLDQSKIHDQELAFACGVALFWFCDDYARHAPDQSGVVAYPKKAFKDMSKGVFEMMREDSFYSGSIDVTPDEIFNCLFEKCQSLNIIHKYSSGMYFVDRNFFNYYADAVNTMPDFCYGDC